jgi:Flp pilus assembly protein TadD
MRIPSALVTAIALAIALPAVAAPTQEEIDAINASRADYDRGKRAIDRMAWKEAIDALEGAVRKDPGNAEFHNLLGFSYRSSGNMEAAFRHYNKALELNPGHRAAREYLGRAYLMTDQPEKAVDQLQQLEKLCPEACRERELLRKAIDDYPWPPPGRSARSY